MKHRVWVEIDLGTLRENFRKISERVSPAGVLCVLKANAYGLGVADFAKALADTPCAGFGVAEPYEALELQAVLADLGREKRVQVLSSILPDEIEPMVDAGVILPLTDVDSARMISEAAVRLGKVAKVQFKIDTGMGRLGILAAQAPQAIAEILRLPNLDCDGIFSHFAMAFDAEDTFTARQIATFKEVLAKSAAFGFKPRYVHIAASDAINNFPECAKAPFNLVRTGINLHGSFDPSGRKALAVKPVLTLKTRVAQVRDLPAGTTLGYGRTWCLAEPTRVATISAGYADGLPLALSNRARVIIGGVECPIIGRISMDYTTVDVSGVADIKPGDEVICFGQSGDCSITPDDWAAIKGTHAYDIICSLGSRVERVAMSRD